MNTFHVQPLNLRKVMAMDPSWFGHLLFDNHMYTQFAIFFGTKTRGDNHRVVSIGYINQVSNNLSRSSLTLNA